MLNSLEYRGNDATGVALVSRSGDIYVHKDHDQAWKFTASDAYKKFIAEFLTSDILCVMGHTRKATKGTPYRNENNHPLQDGAGAIVHNGMLSNDDALFAQHKWHRGAETDSDAIRAIMDDGNGINKDVLSNMSHLSGSVAAACAHPEDPTKLLLLRSGNPLVTADDGQMFFWASDKRAIYRAARPWIKRHGFLMQLMTPGLAFVTMPNDTGWIIGPKGLEWHDKFTASSIKFRHQSYTDVHAPGAYRMRKARFQAAVKPPEPPKVEIAKPARTVPVHSHAPATVRQPPILIESSNGFGVIHYVCCPKCELMMALSPLQRDVPLNRLQCRDCHTNLAEAAKTIKAVQRVN